MLGSGELRLVRLKLIAASADIGYDLIRASEELTGGEYAPARSDLSDAYVARTWT